MATGITSAQVNAAIKPLTPRTTLVVTAKYTKSFGADRFLMSNAAPQNKPQVRKGSASPMFPQDAPWFPLRI